MIRLSVETKYLEMLMRPQLTKTAVALLICSYFSANPASAADWDGSYAANGQCFCVGTISAGLGARIFPTPIGGQTVTQICQGIGAGPGLTRTDNLFNYPVYADPQCGHGPFVAGRAPADSKCAGTLDGKSADSASCQPIGPEWDLQRAFGLKSSASAPENDAPRPAAPLAKVAENATKTVGITQTATETAIGTPRQTASNLLPEPSAGGSDPVTSSGLLTQPVITSTVVTREDAAGGEEKTLKATVISSPSTAGRKLPIRDPLPSFTGKVITIDGVRYLQANPDVSATGGEPGSRIILDDLVFLRDNGAINPADLYRVQPDQGTGSEPTVSNTDSARQSEPAERVSDTPAPQVSVAPDDNSSLPVESPVLPTPLEEVVERSPQAEDAVGLNPEDAASARLRRAKAALEAQALRRSQRREGALSSDITVPQRIESSSDITATPRIESSSVDDVATPIGLPSDRSEKSAGSDGQPQPSDSKPLQSAGGLQTDSTESVVAEDAGAKTERASIVHRAKLALNLPDAGASRNRDFSYLEALPVNFDVGGSGLMLEGSIDRQSRLQFIGRMGMAAEYQELMVGAGYYMVPPDASRLTLVLLAGLEYGNFKVSDNLTPAVEIDFSDSGFFLGMANRLVLSDRVELQGGFSFSSFFGGDAALFGGVHYHLTPQLDLVTRFELGDNDLLGIGVRFYY